MPLVDLWNSDRTQVSGKRIEQLIAFAGEGRLRDGNGTSSELRALLAIVPSDVLDAWIRECLANRFVDFGFVVQDIVNEIGARLNFNVRHGVYRGHSNEGYDGLWQFPDSRAILVESKSSTAYKISLTRIAEYRKQIAPSLNIEPESISILLIVGADDTEELEAQVRGSRFAWDVRLLGIDSLLRLLQLKETLDDLAVERQIQEILIPQEFTRLDRIVDLVFATAEDAAAGSDEQGEDVSEAGEIDASVTVVVPPASFYAEVLPRLERRFAKPLVKRSRVIWGSPDDSVVLSCQVSKEYKRNDMHYWYGLKRGTKEALEKHGNAYCCFGLGSPERIAVIPYQVIASHLDRFFTSQDGAAGIMHWHIRFRRDGDRVDLLVNRDQDKLVVSEYLLRS